MPTNPADQASVNTRIRTVIVDDTMDLGKNEQCCCSVAQPRTIHDREVLYKLQMGFVQEGLNFAVGIVPCCCFCTNATRSDLFSVKSPTRGSVIALLLVDGNVIGRAGSRLDRSIIATGTGRFYDDDDEHCGLAAVESPHHNNDEQEPIHLLLEITFLISYANNFYHSPKCQRSMRSQRLAVWR